MPIYEDDGSTGYLIGHVYEDDGTTLHKIGHVYEDDGTALHLIYTSSVILKNLLSSEMNVLGYWQDHGYWVSTHEGTALSTVAGHRYYVRVLATANAHPCIHGGTAYGRADAKFAGVTISSALNAQWNTGHAIVTATSNSTTPQLIQTRDGSDQGRTDAYFYMVVDLTELEAATGVTYTADSFWSLIGSTVFYNTKEINV